MGARGQGFCMPALVPALRSGSDVRLVLLHKTMVGLMRGERMRTRPADTSVHELLLHFH